MFHVKHFYILSNSRSSASRLLHSNLSVFCPREGLVYFHPGVELLLQALFQINYLGGLCRLCDCAFLALLPARATFGFSRRTDSLFFYDFPGPQQLRSASGKANKVGAWPAVN